MLLQRIKLRIPSICVGKQNIGTIRFQNNIKSYSIFIMNKSSQISRKTNETDIDISLKINGSGIRTINTPVGFLESHVGSILPNTAYLI